jgi:Ca2+/Na+ antiporter
MRAEASYPRQHFPLAAAPLLLALVLYTLQHSGDGVVPSPLKHLFRRDEEARCAVDLSSPTACHLVKGRCPDFDNDGLIPYLRIYACASISAKPIVILVLAVWLLVLFASMAMAAGEFLSVHLGFIVKTLGISENVAGVTIFAFGNGCTDLFSTIGEMLPLRHTACPIFLQTRSPRYLLNIFRTAAMSSNSGSLAISELFGAGAFITTVVLGLITLTQPFVVDPRSFVGDVVWFVIAASLLIAFLADGQLVLPECLGIIGLYVTFVCLAIFRSHKKPTESRDPASDPLLTGSDLAHDSPDDLLLADSPVENDHPNLEGTPDEAPEPTDQQIAHVAVHGDHEPVQVEPDSSSTSQVSEELTLPPVLGISDRPSPDGMVGRSLNILLEGFHPLATWSEQSASEKLLTALSAPLLLPITLTVPTVSSNAEHLATELGDRTALDPAPRTSLAARPIRPFHHLFLDWGLLSFKDFHTHPLLCLQLLLGPQFFTVVIAHQAFDVTYSYGIVICIAVGLCMTIALALTILPSERTSSPRTSTAANLRSIFGFLTSLTWIYLTATSAVSALMTLALILRIPTALLGATIFAIGQSSNDLVANIAVAKRGMPVLAASACFGGPMMNMLLGIGVGGLSQLLKTGASTYVFKPAAGMFVSAVCLICGLAVTLAYAFSHSWMLGRGLGCGLIGVWGVFTVVNVALSMSL